MHDALMHHTKLQINQEIEKTSEHVHLFKNIAFEPCLGSLITLLDSNFSTQIPCDSRFVLLLFLIFYLRSSLLELPSFGLSIIFFFWYLHLGYIGSPCVLRVLYSPALAGFLSSLRLSQVEGGEKSLLFRLQNKQILCYKQQIRKKV